MIHSLTNIHPDAKIGKGVTVGPFTSISADVEIGDGTWIGPNVSVMDGSRIGKNCEIHPGAVISNKPQDLKYEGEKTLTFIGDGTVVRECATINRGTAHRSKTVVGKGCLIMAYVHIAHDCVLGDHCILANSVQVAGHVQIDDHARLGGTTAVHQFVRIGCHTMVGGGSLVRKDVPPFVMAAREPLIYSGVNSVGLQRSGYSNQEIDQISDIYRYFYLKKYNKAQALKMIETDLPDTPERRLILDFIHNSERGVIKGNH